MNRVFIDTEFIEDGRTIDLISIGMVAGNGRELYLQNLDCHFRRANLWVKENVYPHLRYFDSKKLKPYIGPYEAPGAWSVWASRRQIAERVVAFCDPAVNGPLELVGYYSAYDHVVICQLFGKMIDLPKGFPMWTNDLQQMAYEQGVTDLDTRVIHANEHDALEDARWNKAAWYWLHHRKKEAAPQEAA